ncbi:hypothetical protein AB6A40_010626 [Gnathostoma spinigerum]|uniref:Membrane protein BRI3 n=1 Tax=Gnathostoma spinigerum TaxID=75299 RepID=A0ABD6F321_9BILA
MDGVIPPKDSGSKDGSNDNLTSQLNQHISVPSAPMLHSNIEIHTETLVGSRSNVPVVTEPSPYPEPPPSYQAAMAMAYPAGSSVYPPTSPPYPVGTVNSFPPSTAPYPTNAFVQQGGHDANIQPKTNYGGVTLPPCYAPLPTSVSGMYPFPTVLEVPTPTPSTQVVVNVPPTATGNCIHCRVGTVASETDLCCLLCLIILAVFTFPFGLLFLCCIPCTMHRRCRNCRRMG